MYIFVDLSDYFFELISQSPRVQDSMYIFSILLLRESTVPNSLLSRVYRNAYFLDFTQILRIVILVAKNALYVSS